ncbi:Signal transduction histidine kinase [Frankia canadensis]|uniref:Sensor-like histidine kinase SenX3 n=1 Tax=Frankia canadensis TaxID=1836972 RepID=A0A2I2KWL0_9ACTN|nr:ATP-binding protein [Frankia canadensis]SNQ50049.1 Signal transduction histidine kinase [Frankia canadensis]SOU57339.1 Signal transduction histidine kinase [Frankia canadensis]
MTLVPGRTSPHSAPTGPDGGADEGAVLPARLVRRVLSGLPTGLVVLDSADRVVMVNTVARRMGVVRQDELALAELAELVRATRLAGSDRERQIDLPPVPEPPLTRPRPDQKALAVRTRARILDSAGHVAVILDDITESRRVEAVRRDFVANVSHELKTPVGALHVLAEAVAAASEDPVAVRRFASRMTHESARLARLVQEIIDLSRLQGAEPLPDLRPLPTAELLTEAVDRTRLAAQAHAISVAVIGDGGLRVLGDENQLVTAVANLLDNAISYSPRGTRVVLGVRRSGRTVEISVADEGIGISERDLERVFERFYRADPARSRATGGTGLGLAIVKHIATNHGGTVTVWSAEGAGSTFTLRLPLFTDDPAAVAPAEEHDVAETAETVETAGVDGSGGEAGSGSGEVASSGAAGRAAEAPGSGGTPEAGGVEVPAGSGATDEFGDVPDDHDARGDHGGRGVVASARSGSAGPSEVTGENR